MQIIITFSQCYLFLACHRAFWSLFQQLRPLLLKSLSIPHIFTFYISFNLFFCLYLFLSPNLSLSLFNISSMNPLCLFFSNACFLFIYILLFLPASLPIYLSFQNFSFFLSLSLYVYHFFFFCWLRKSFLLKLFIFPHLIFFLRLFSHFSISIS